MEGKSFLSWLYYFLHLPLGILPTLPLYHRLFGSFGAVVAIIALALSPFSQQVATYRTRLVQADTSATIPTALNYTGVLPGDNKPCMSFLVITLRGCQANL